MNCRLDGLSQQIVMMTSFTIPGVAEKIAAKNARLAVESGKTATGR